MRIYTESLAHRNAGFRLGGWIELDELEASEAWEEMQRVTKGADEMAVTDHEGFRPLDLGENPGAYIRVLEVLDEARNRGYEDPGAVMAWLSHDTYPLMREDPEDLVRLFADAYLGEWPGLTEDAALAAYLLEMYDEDLRTRLKRLPTPAEPTCYFDYSSWAQDLRLGGEVWAEQAGDGAASFYLFTTR